MEIFCNELDTGLAKRTYKKANSWEISQKLNKIDSGHWYFLRQTESAAETNIKARNHDFPFDFCNIIKYRRHYEVMFQGVNNFGIFFNKFHHSHLDKKFKSLEEALPYALSMSYYVDCCNFKCPSWAKGKRVN